MSKDDGIDGDLTAKKAKARVDDTSLSSGVRKGPRRRKEF